MEGGWQFDASRWERPGYVALEGKAYRGTEPTDFFLMVGREHISLDVRSLRPQSFLLIECFSAVLGKPDTDPAPVNIGELMDSVDEIPVTVTWSFPPASRGELLHRLEALLAATPDQPGTASQEEEPGTRWG